MIGFVVRTLRLFLTFRFRLPLSVFLILRDPRMFVVTMVLVENDFGM